MDNVFKQQTRFFSSFMPFSSLYLTHCSLFAPSASFYHHHLALFLLLIYRQYYPFHHHHVIICHISSSFLHLSSRVSYFHFVTYFDLHFHLSHIKSRPGVTFYLYLLFLRFTTMIFTVKFVP